MIKVICAIGSRGEFGYQQGLPWGHCKEDMKHFANYTKGKTLVMGRKTYESLPPSGLPNRELVVVTKDHMLYKGSETVSFTDMSGKPLNEFLKSWEPHTKDGDFVVIGGPEFILEALDIADEVSVSFIMGSQVGPFDHDVSMNMGLFNMKLYGSFERQSRNYIMSKPNKLHVSIENWKRREE